MGNNNEVKAAIVSLLWRVVEEHKQKAKAHETLTRIRSNTAPVPAPVYENLDEFVKYRNRAANYGRIINKAEAEITTADGKLRELARGLYNFVPVGVWFRFEDYGIRLCLHASNPVLEIIPWHECKAKLQEAEATTWAAT